MLLRRLGIALVILLLPGVLLAPVWRLGGLGAGEDDILYYFPARLFFHNTVQAGQWPWLNPWVGLGRPFMADPQTACWYPFTWLFAIWPPLLAYAASLWAHYSLAMWGTYRLLRSYVLDRRAALFGGIVFAFCGFMLAHRAHFTMQAAAAWTPWVFWRLRRYVQHSGDGTSRGLGWAVIVLTLQCLAGHVQVAAITALGTLVLLLAEAWSNTMSVRWSVVRRWLLAWAWAGGLFAIQWLPTLVYTRLCTRMERGYLGFVENSWYPPSFLTLVLPMFYGQRTPNFFSQPWWGVSHQVEQLAYVGLVPLLLVIAVLRGGWRADALKRPWVILGGFGFLLALGILSPLSPILYLVPGSGLFRCPARDILLINLALAVLAAMALHDLGAPASPRRVRLRAALQRLTRRPIRAMILLILVPAVLMGLLATLILWLMPDLVPNLVPTDAYLAPLRTLQPWNSALWVPVITAIVSLVILGLAARRWQKPAWLWLPILVATIDLGVIGWTIDVPAGVRSPTELLTPREPEPWMQEIAESPHRLWVVTRRQGWTPGEYVDPIDKAVANTNMLRGVASLTDYGPLQPKVFVQEFKMQPWGESWDAERLLLETDWMRVVNVGWVLLCDRDWPEPAGCELVTTTAAGWRLYRNPAAAGWALFEHAEQPGVMRFERESPSSFTTWIDTWPGNTAKAAEQPRVVVSELALPGWSAYLTGHLVQTETLGDLLLAVRVPDGRAVEINWSYFPPGLIVGAIISGGSLLALILLVVSQRIWRTPKDQSVSPVAQAPNGGDWV